MLYVCPTPIGNLGDITLRVLDVLREADLVAAEDTRRTRKLLSHFHISKPVVSLFEHNELKRLPEMLRRLQAGEKVALVSDAGMPGICDPGYKLIRAALEKGYPVEVLPGASAIETSLVASGFATDSFVFTGYLPRKKGELSAALQAIAAEPRTCVSFEAPHRLRSTLSAAAALLGDRQIAVCRELTKKFEEIYRDSAAGLLKALPDKIRGEIVLVFEPGPGRKPEETAGEAELAEAIEMMLAEGLSARRASELASLLAEVPKNRAYRLAIEIRRGNK